MKQTETRSGGRKIPKKTWRKIGFMAAILFWPLACFIWNNIVININSFVLAFSEYDIDTKAFTFSAGFENFARVINDVRYSYEIKGAVINSFLYYFVGLAMMPINLIVSFMIYKKVYFSKFFIVVLFFPSIISSMGHCVQIYRRIFIAVDLSRHYGQSDHVFGYCVWCTDRLPNLDGTCGRPCDLYRRDGADLARTR